MTNRYFVNLLPDGNDLTSEIIKQFNDSREQVRFDLFQFQDHIIGVKRCDIKYNSVSMENVIVAIEFEEEEQMLSYKKAYGIDYLNSFFDASWPKQDKVRKQNKQRLQDDSMKAVNHLNDQLEY